MNAKTDNDLAIKLYRSYRALQLRLSDDDEDLDRRFDKIMADIDHCRRPSRSHWFGGHRVTLRRARTCLKRLLAPTTAKTAILGASAALIGRTLHVAHGLIGLSLTALIGAALSTAVAVLTYPRACYAPGAEKSQFTQPDDVGAVCVPAEGGVADDRG